ncbi:response regulator transcription factor [Actinomadura alba]|uniref:Sensory transduction protein RegX3 n=1 Tax=Actinomadura alba TaxID=406431 RepID=A0ABR7LM12_9ACTN|nr:response regulator transcription factor [Actinomadura alba]MBC6465806.1 response regulator transcription factor [Actinomadura alba]
MRVLLVEDDRRFAAALTKSLHQCGYEVEHVTTVAAAMRAPLCDVFLLDLTLPDGDGLDVCRKLRAHSDVAIIMVSARGTERDRVNGLRAGADDYLVKPFGIAELQARLDAVLRRVRPRAAGVRVLGGLRVDLDGRLAYVNDALVKLTPKEFTVLAVLVRETGVVVRREQLIREVWQTSWRGKSRALDVHVSTLRTKVRAAARVEAVHAVGYRLRALDQAEEPAWSGNGPYLTYPYPSYG